MPCAVLLDNFRRARKISGFDFFRMEALTEFFNSPAQMAAMFVCALFIGMSKTGVQGITMISVPVMALTFGAKESTGVILPMLCFADILAVLYYRHSVQWRYVFALLPAAVVGLFAALPADRVVPREFFGHLMGFCILVGLVAMVWSEIKKPDSDAVSHKWWYAAFFGVLGGFTTMIGNAAGGVMAVYLLSMRMKKLAFVGTNAWFFLVINYTKIPLQVFAWNNISAQTLLLDAVSIPFIVAGAVFGVWFVKKLPERAYRIFVIVSTFLSTLLMFF
mgnify:CR=1 FL=1